ncbi:hypothetical protein LEP1GSC050_1797 [Leptospira broomii serovar Hurstbridge str. 5399]|uniref:Uncharacterized protein n=1 Tax=Leptospira broomii serovar Hurstbridge str. 5399 TaxID=1049789 RepID=T0G8X8_9LEPT|nr:hypothetical protein LEP1GSC050_1797 [Leptospira broomii serovar Hurstbridge str. 5399]
MFGLYGASLFLENRLVEILDCLGTPFFKLLNVRNIRYVKYYK